MTQFPPNDSSLDAARLATPIAAAPSARDDVDRPNWHDDLEVRAGALALRITQIAAGDIPGAAAGDAADDATDATGGEAVRTVPGGPEGVAERIAVLLLETLAADAVACYGRLDRGAEAALPRLRRVALVARGRRVAPRELRRLGRAARLALKHRRLMGAEDLRRWLAQPDDGPWRALSLPLGAPAPWLAVAVLWQNGVAADADDDSSAHAALLARVAPAVQLALGAHSAAPLNSPMQIVPDPAPSEPSTPSAPSEQSPSEHGALEDIFAHSSEAVLIVGRDFVISDTNPAFGRLTGWDAVDAPPASRRACMEVLRCRDPRGALLCQTSSCPLAEAFSSESGACLRDLTWEMRDGGLREVSASFTAERRPGARRAVIIARDVTSLSAANRLRANFMSMISHELRTPLNSLNGFLEIVLERHIGPLNERQREFLGYVRDSGAQLATLVEDIIIISKADAGQFALRLAPVEISKLVDETLAGIAVSAARAEVQIVCELPPDLPPIQADGLRLKQVLTNLLANAVKFSPPDGEVILSARTNGEVLVFAVRDEGEGIAPEDQARIFERFYQSEASAQQHPGGYGLGLSIAKLIVEEHGGRIWVESRPGHGAIFAFTLPLGLSSPGAHLTPDSLP
jgi:two-component system phosphate regulon sensor histidine kinase PhoR